MNIVFAISGMGFGGAERVVSVLSNELVKEHNVSIVLTSGGDNCAYKLDSRVNLISVTQDKSNIKTWRNFRKTCRGLHPDVVIAFMTGVGIMAACFLCKTKIPVLVSERCDPYAKDMKPGFKVALLGKIAPFFTKGYIFQSEGAKAYYPNMVQKKSCIILNPLNVEELPNREDDKVDNRIVSVGRLHPQKNHRMLIQAFANSEARHGHTLHIYGDGALREELEALIKNLGMEEKIFLEGNSSHVHEDIKNAKLFVFTSDYEGLPNALMEAMAIGIPSISTDCSPGGARMLINDGENGVLIPRGDEKRLTEELDKLTQNYDYARILGKNAKGLREKTRISVIANEWITKINEFINR